MSAPWWDYMRYRHRPVSPDSKLYRFWAIVVMLSALVLFGCDAAKTMPEGHVRVNIDSTYDGGWHTRNAHTRCVVVVTDANGLRHTKRGYAVFKGKKHAQTVSIYLNHKYQRSVDSNSYCGGFER